MLTPRLYLWLVAISGLVMVSVPQHFGVLVMFAAVYNANLTFVMQFSNSETHMMKANFPGHITTYLDRKCF